MGPFLHYPKMPYPRHPIFHHIIPKLSSLGHCYHILQYPPTHTRYFFYKKGVYKKVLIFLSKFKKVYINRTYYLNKVFNKGSKKQDISINQNTREKLNKKTMVIGIIIQPLRIYHTYACFSTSVELQV